MSGEYMTTTLSDRQIGLDIVAGLSILISRNLSKLASEQTCPGANADRMDDKIKEYSKAIERYRMIRELFEDVLNGVIIRDDQ